MAGRGKAGVSLEMPRLGPAVPTQPPLQAYPSSLTLCDYPLPSEHSPSPAPLALLLLSPKISLP